MKLSGKILKLRKQNGMSQEELAEKLDVSRQAISRWEVGSAQPDASNILQLSKLFGVTADYLLNDDYESDHDVPMIRDTEAAANNKLKKVVGICVGSFGLLGNFILYIISRFIKVMIPHPVYDNGKISFYEFSSQFTGYSFKYFVKEHNLELLVTGFFVLVIVGIFTAFVPKEKVLTFLRTIKSRFKIKKNTD